MCTELWKISQGDPRSTHNL